MKQKHAVKTLDKYANAYVRIVNEETNEELIRYDLGEDFSIETAIVVGELYRHNGEWKFSCNWHGYQGGLARIVNDFGLNRLIIKVRRAVRRDVFMSISFIKRTAH